MYKDIVVSDMKKPIRNLQASQRTDLRDFFYETPNLQVSSKIVMELKQNSITIIKQQSISSHFKLRNMESLFNFKFQTIKNSNDTIIGLILNLETNIFKLYSGSHIVLDRWVNALQKSLVRWGFYQQYKAVDKIGEGKFASVFAAYRRKDQEKVAVKAFLKKELFQQQKGMNGLRKEIQILRQLESQYTIKLQVVYQTEKSYYLVFQHIDGKQLRKVLQERTLSQNQIKVIIQNLCCGLLYLGQKQIVHRDLKPQNIVYNQKTQTSVIIDFGLATFSYSKTHVYNNCGTPGFVPPQYFKYHNQPIQPIGDVFSLGVCLHLMMFRRLPYLEQSCNQILQQNRQGNVSISNNKLSYSSQIFNLLKKMLQITPMKRITVQEILQDQIFHNCYFSNRQMGITKQKGIERERELLNEKEKQKLPKTNEYNLTKQDFSVATNQLSNSDCFFNSIKFMLQI